MSAKMPIISNGLNLIFFILVANEQEIIICMLK